MIFNRFCKIRKEPSATSSWQIAIFFISCTFCKQIYPHIAPAYIMPFCSTTHGFSSRMNLNNRVCAWSTLGNLTKTTTCRTTRRTSLGIYIKNVISSSDIYSCWISGRLSSSPTSRNYNFHILVFIDLTPWRRARGWSWGGGRNHPSFKPQLVNLFIEIV